MTESIQDILKKNKLSITDARTQILQLFQKSKGALSHANIEKSAKASLDRVTIYRTLQSFVEKGIIHTIPTDDNSIQYALCKGNCEEGQHHDHHVHFICSKCGKTFCLDHTNIPSIDLPHNFEMENVEMIVKGTCELCRS